MSEYLKSVWNLKHNIRYSIIKVLVLFHCLSNISLSSLQAMNKSESEYLTDVNIYQNIPDWNNF